MPRSQAALPKRLDIHSLALRLFATMTTAVDSTKRYIDGIDANALSRQNECARLP